MFGGMADFHSETMSVITNDMAPGEGPALHRHPYEEVFVIVEGEATFTLGDETLVVRGGEPPIVAGPHVAHAFKNTGTGRLITVDIHASPEFKTEWL
jgi:mannose-6-phosphate isomerase-like protein (cupin superfamily)